MERSSEVKISTTFLIIIFLTLILSFIAIYWSISTVIWEGEYANALLWLLMGFIGLSLATYMLYQTRRRIIISIRPQPIMTTLVCDKCGFKNLREFKRGDYVFKETDEKCPKCNENMYIAAIYREVKETK